MKQIIIVFLLFLTISITAEEFDKNIYQRTTLKELPRGIPNNILFFKTDVIFVNTVDNSRLGNGYISCIFNQINDWPDEGSHFPYPVELTLPKVGQFVTIYLRIFPETFENTGIRKTLIDNIQFPAESFDFKPTHKTLDQVNIINETGGMMMTLFTIDTGVEVQMLERESQQWAPILTADGFGGWVEYRYLEPISQSNTSTKMLENKEEPESSQTTKDSQFPLWLFIGGGLVLLAVGVGVVVIVKRKKG